MRSTVAESKSIFQKHPKTTIFLSILIALLSIDFVLARLISKDSDCREASVYYHHGLTKNCSCEQAWGPYHCRLYTNSLGMKDASVRNVPLKSEKYRIVFLGDSFTEGICIPYEETFVGLLASNLAEKGVEVLNAAVVSYSPRIYYLKALYLIKLGLKIDEIFVCVDMSDILDEFAFEHYSSGMRPSIYNRIRATMERNSACLTLSRPVLSQAIQKVYTTLVSSKSVET